jgi:hypothetical protein
MMSIINSTLPLIMIAYLFYFRRGRSLNNLLLMTLFLSYFAFATNYTNYGLDFDLYRYLHKFIGVLAVVGLVHHVFKNNITILNNGVFYLLLMFLLAIGVSYFGNELNIQHYLHYARNFLFISLLVLFIYFKLDTNKKVDELLRFIVGLVLILSIFAIIQAVFTDDRARVQLFYSNPNYLSVALMFGFSILLFIKTEFKVMKLVLVAFVILSTKSHAVLVSSVILLLLYAFKNRGAVSPNSFFMGLIILIISSSVFFHQKIAEIYHNEVRVSLAKIAFNAYSGNLVNGIGYGQFRTQFYKYTNNEVLKNSEVNTAVLSYDSSLSDRFIKNLGMTRNMEKMTHNDLFKIISELGSLGVAFILCYFYKLYFKLGILFKNSQEYFYISLSLLIGSLIFSLLHNNITSFVFWFILFFPFVVNRNYLKQ